MEILLAVLAGILALISGIGLFFIKLTKTKQQLRYISEQLSLEQYQRQQIEQSLKDTKHKCHHEQQQLLEQSLEDTKRNWAALSEKHRQAQKQHQQVKQTLEDIKHELTTTLEQQNREQQQHQQIEHSLENTKRKLAETLEQLNNEQQRCLKLEQFIGLKEIKWNESTQTEANSKHAISLQPTKIYNIKSLSSGKVLHVAQGSLKDGMPISQDTWDGGQNQQWRFQALGGIDQDYYQIFSIRSNKCLNVSLSSKENFAPINQYQGYGGDNQKWKLIPVSEESFVIQCKHSGKVLTISEDQICQDRLHNDNDNKQGWIITEIST
jgi:hypothetical protein